MKSILFINKKESRLTVECDNKREFQREYENIWEGGKM